MAKARAISIALVRAMAAFALSLSTAVPVAAADWAPAFAPAPIANDWISVGAGGRYWHVEAKGYTHFEGHVVGFIAQPQVVNWRADHFGGFIQANIKFGPYPVFFD